ncbi:MAG: hypothetical protein ACYDG2_12995 [Ruminiclostridium sp.]
MDINMNTEENESKLASFYKDLRDLNEELKRSISKVDTRLSGFNHGEEWVKREIDHKTFCQKHIEQNQFLMDVLRTQVKRDYSMEIEDLL